MTKLVEFKNHKGEILRGLFDKTKSKKGIIFVHGFERTTIESKFKNIVDKLRGKINLFRFDFSGCGLSDGSFKDLTMAKLTKELGTAIETFKKISKAKKISLVGHSLGCAIILEYLLDHESEVDKVVFLAPALNQKDLQRYWFVKNHIQDEITWSNFRKYFGEIKDVFESDMEKSLRMTKEHLVSNKYFLETKDSDYQRLLDLLPDSLSNFLVVHGDADDKVPIQSNDKLCRAMKKIVVSGGDHDLQRPDMVKQYLDKVTQFLLKD